MYKSTFMGMNTALRGVLAHQNALDVTGHNIANISTDGYTRQRAQMSTAPAWSNASLLSQVSPGQIGTGVEVLRIERIRDQYLDTNVRTQLGRQANQQAMVEHLEQIEGMLNEPGANGISQLLNEYYSAMDAVANDANNTGARQKFANAASALAQAFRDLDANLNAVQATANAKIDDSVSQINSISARIAQLNTQIKSAIEHNHQPNDLLDARDMLLDDLAKMVNVTVTTNNVDQTVTVSLGTFGNIVDPAVPGTGMNTVLRSDIETAFDNGEILQGSLLADLQVWNPAGSGPAGTGVVDTIRANLDSFVNEFVTVMNAAHNNPPNTFDQDGNPGGNIFVGTTAATFALDAGNNILLNPRLIAAASIAGATSDGSVFTNILDTIRNSGQAGLGGVSFENFYKTQIVLNVGAQAESANQALGNSNAMVEMALSRRMQVSGVSLDEEMSNMLRFQHAYNASARVMSTMDELLDVLINRTGRVGL